MKKLITLLSFSLLLTACGWQLRGANNSSNSVKELYVSAVDSKGALVSEMRQLLKSYHIREIEDEKVAHYAIYIKEETKDKRTAGVGGDAASSAYEITLKAKYEIHLLDTKAVSEGTAIVVRSYNYNTGAINSATQEEIVLDQEMRRDLAQQMLRRLNAVVANPDTTGESTPNKNKKRK